MKILMLGNSFTYCNDMPQLLAAVLNADVTASTRGGAYLHDRLCEDDELAQQTRELLGKEKWDYVVLQEQSSTPVFDKAGFLDSTARLCSMIRENGAKPLMYATWAYQEGTEKLASTNLSYEEMDAALYASYHEAAEANDALIADVGKAFTAVRGVIGLYRPDAYHPSEAGSLLAAETIARIIEADAPNA